MAQRPLTTQSDPLESLLKEIDLAVSTPATPAPAPTSSLDSLLGDIDRAITTPPAKPPIPLAPRPAPQPRRQPAAMATVIDPIMDSSDPVIREGMRRTNELRAQRLAPPALPPPPEPPADTMLAKVLDAPRQLARGLGAGLVAGPAEAIAATAAAVDPSRYGRNLEVAQRGSEMLAPPEAIAADVFEKPDVLLDPQWWTYNGGQAIGSILSLAGAGRVGPMAASGAATALRLGPVAAQRLLAVGGPAVATAAETWLEAGLGYSDAIKAGKSPDEAGQIAAQIAAGNAALLGASNLPLFNPQLKSRLGNMFVSAFTEGAQEGGQTVLGNYAQGRPLGEGLGTALAVGSLAGGGFSALEHRGAPAGAPPPAPPLDVVEDLPLRDPAVQSVPPASTDVVAAIDSALGATTPGPEFTPVGEEPIVPPAEPPVPSADVVDRIQEKLAAGAQLGTPEARAAFAERQRVEGVRNEPTAPAPPAADLPTLKRERKQLLLVDRDLTDAEEDRLGELNAQIKTLESAQPAAAPTSEIPVTPKAFDPARAVADLPGPGDVKSHPLGSALVALGDLRGVGGGIPIHRFSEQEQAAIRAAGVREDTQTSAPDDDGGTYDYRVFDEGQLWDLRQAYQNRGKATPPAAAEPSPLPVQDKAAAPPDPQAQAADVLSRIVEYQDEHGTVRAIAENQRAKILENLKGLKVTAIKETKPGIFKITTAGPYGQKKPQHYIVRVDGGTAFDTPTMPTPKTRNDRDYEPLPAGQRYDEKGYASRWHGTEAEQQTLDTINAREKAGQRLTKKDVQARDRAKERIRESRDSAKLHHRIDVAVSKWLDEIPHEDLTKVSGHDLARLREAAYAAARLEGRARAAQYAPDDALLEALDAERSRRYKADDEARVRIELPGVRPRDKHGVVRKQKPTLIEHEGKTFVQGEGGSSGRGRTTHTGYRVVPMSEYSGALGPWTEAEYMDALRETTSLRSFRHSSADATTPTEDLVATIERGLRVDEARGHHSGVIYTIDGKNYVATGETAEITYPEENAKQKADYDKRMAEDKAQREAALERFRALDKELGHPDGEDDGEGIYWDRIRDVREIAADPGDDTRTYYIEAGVADLEEIKRERAKKLPVTDKQDAPATAAPEEAPSHEPFSFRSGNTRSPADLEGYIKAGQPIGITAQASYNIYARAAQYAERGGLVFIDSGAFGDPDVDFDAVFQFYDRFIDRIPAEHRHNVYVVAPDRVGDPEATRKLQTAYAEPIKAMLKLGASVIVPVQVGPDMADTAAGVVTQFAGALVGLPGNKAAITRKDLDDTLAGIKAAISAEQFEGVHFLGVGDKNPRFMRLANAVYDVFPDARVTGDSNRTRSLMAKGRPAHNDAQQLKEERAEGDIDNEWASDTTELTGSFYHGNLKDFTDAELKILAGATGTTVKQLRLAARGNMGVFLEDRADPQAIDLAMYRIAKARGEKRHAPGARTDAIAKHDAKPKPPAIPVQDKAAPVPTSGSWKAEIDDGSGFSSNALRFATEEEAKASGRQIFDRWMAAKDMRVVRSDDPVNYRHVDGENIPLEEEPAAAPSEPDYASMSDEEIAKLAIAAVGQQQATTPPPAPHKGGRFTRTKALEEKGVKGYVVKQGSGANEYFAARIIVRGRIRAEYDTDTESEANDWLVDKHREILEQEQASPRNTVNPAAHKKLESYLKAIGYDDVVRKKDGRVLVRVTRSGRRLRFTFQLGRVRAHNQSQERTAAFTDFRKDVRRFTSAIPQRPAEPAKLHQESAVSDKPAVPATPLPAPKAWKPTKLTTKGTRIEWDSVAGWVRGFWELKKRQDRRISSKGYTDLRAHLELLAKQPREFFDASTRQALAETRTILEDHFAKPKGQNAGTPYEKAINEVNNAIHRTDNKLKPITREQLIERIVGAARDPEPDVRESFQTKGTDGKWYRAGVNSMPHGVAPAVPRESRSIGWSILTRDGTTVGKLHPSRAELLAEWNRGQDRKASELRADLKKKDRAALENSARYWLKGDAIWYRLVDEPLPVAPRAAAAPAPQPARPAEPKKAEIQLPPSATGPIPDGHIRLALEGQKGSKSPHYVDVPGATIGLFGVHQPYDPKARAVDEKGKWKITHLPSGMSVARNIPNKEAAYWAASEFMKLLPRDVWEGLKTEAAAAKAIQGEARARALDLATNARVLWRKAGQPKIRPETRAAKEPAPAPPAPPPAAVATKKPAPYKAPKPLAPGTTVLVAREFPRAPVPSSWKRAATEAERAVIFQAGNTVDGYSDIDRVVGYRPTSAEDGWEVTVQRQGEGPRRHATNPTVIKDEYRDRVKPEWVYTYTAPEPAKATVPVQDKKAARKKADALAALKAGNFDAIAPATVDVIENALEAYLVRQGGGGIVRLAGIQQLGFAKWLDSLQLLDEESFDGIVRPLLTTSAPFPVQDKERQAIADARAANKAERDALVEQLKKKLNNQLNSGAPVDPETITLMVKIMRTYLKDGVLVFREATLAFREEYGEGFLLQVAPYWEQVWLMLRKEQQSVAATLAAEPKQVEIVPTPAPTSRLAVQLYSVFRPNPDQIPTDPRELRRLASRVTGLSEQQIADQVDELNDAVEAALAQQIAPSVPGNVPLAAALEEARQVEAKLPRAHRTLEKTALQQFSTPLPIAVAAAHAAKVRKGELVLEPTAGTGNLVAGVILKQDGGADVLVVELSDRRADLLRAQGYNVLQGDYLTARVSQPDVIISNPPWGKYSTGKYGRGIGLEFSPIDVAERFVAKMMRDLAPGGRLVAVMPTTMLESTAFKKWLRETHFVRAIIKSPPKAYDTRATSVESVLLVVDKVAPPVKGGPLPAVVDAADWQAYVSAVEAIGERPAQTGERRTSDAAAPTAERGPDRVRGSAGTGRAKSGRNAAVGTGRDAELVAPGPDSGGRGTVDAGGAPDGAAPPPDGAPPVRVSGPSNDTRREAAGSQFFAPYARRSAFGGQPHPKLLVEAKQLAGVPYPPLTATLTPSMKAAVDAGRVSVEQAEQALAALQANSGDKPFGYLAADAVGVGKSREIALTILGAMDRAKAEKRPLRLMLTTKSRDNVEDLLGEIHYVASGKDASQGGTVPFDLYRLADDYPGAKKAGNDYEPLPKAQYAVYVVDSYNVAPFRQALADVELHGIVGDEVQRFSNQDAAIGGAWLNLHARIMRGVARPQQFFSYFTATPAQKVEDYRYLYGLRLWPIDGFADWLDLVTGGADEKKARELADATERGSIADLDAVVKNTGDDVVGGDADSANTKDDRKRKNAWQKYASNVFAQRLTPAEAEQIPREWKMLGRFSARDLWRKGTSFEIHTATLSDAHRHKYDQFVELSLDIMQTAYKYGLYDKSGRANRFGVTGALQFAAKRIQMQPALEEAVKLAKEYAAQGYQPVLSIINVTEMSDQRGHLVAAIEKINTRVVDEDPGDPDGGMTDLGEIPEAVIDRARLMDRVRDLGSFPDPVEYIAEELGQDKVAFIIGKEKAHRRKASGEFQSGKRTYAVISGAGSTGINLDQRIRTDVGPGHGRRVFLDVQYEWSAMEAVQRYGRVDRASSIAPPKIVAITFGNASEKKFLATIANRMAALGALSKGGAESTGAAGNALEEFEITGDDALEAARRAYAESDEETKRSFATVKSAFRDPNRNGKAPDQSDFDPFKPSADAHGVQMIDFQLPLLLMPVDQANAFWEKFIKYRDELRAASGERDLMRSARFAGEVLETHNLKENLSLYAVKNEEGKKFGILVGLITPEMPRLRMLLRGARDGDDAEGGRSADVQVRRRYVTFSAGDQIITGLQVPWTRVAHVASSYGASANGPALDTPEAVLAYLKAGESITLSVTNPDSRKPWVLRYRPSDGRIAIDNARMQDRNQLLNNGADYVPVGNYWRVKDLAKFLDRWPVPDQTPAKPSSDRPLAMSSAPLPLPTRQTLNAIPVTDRMRPSSIVANLRKAFGEVPVNVGRFRQRAFGIYKRGPQAIRVKVANELQVIAHEFGHHVAEAVLKIPRDRRQPWADELLELGQATSKPSYTKDEQRKEGEAEFFRLYMIEPAEARAEAPLYYVEFERNLERQPELHDAIQQLRRDVEGLISQDPATRGRLKIDFTGAEPPKSVVKLLAQDPKAGLAELARLWTTDLHALKATVREMADGRPLAYSDDAWVLAEAARRSDSRAESFLKHGVTGRDGRFVGTSLAAAIAPVSDRMQDLSAYLTSLRALEVIEKKGKNPALTNTEASEIIRQIESDPRAADFARARDGVYSYLAALRTYMVENGILSDLVDAQLAKEIFYVPMQRVRDQVGGRLAGGGQRIANRSTPIKRMKGSGNDVIDPLESIIRNTLEIVNAVEHNRAMAALVAQAEASAGSGKWLEVIPTPQVATRVDLKQVTDAVRDEVEAALGEELPDNFELKGLATVFTPATFAIGGKNLVTVIRNGERQFVEIHHQGLYDAILAIPPRALGDVVRWAAQVASILRAGATGTPGFIFRNMVRDPLVAFMQSRSGHVPWYDMARGLASLVLNDEDAKLFMSRGLMQSTLVGADQTRDRVREALQGLPVKTKKDIAKHLVWHPIQALRLLSSLSEASTRLGEFKLQLESGGKPRRPGLLGIVDRARSTAAKSTDEETLTRAAFAASEVTTNFQRGGAVSREISHYKAFFNARVQGYVRIGETMVADPLAFGLNVSSLVLLSYMLLALNYDDEEYQRIPDWEKNTYWHIPVAGGFARVPKPFEWAAIPNIIEAALTWKWNENPDAKSRMTQQFGELTPASAAAAITPTVILPLLEAGLNYDTFRDRPIVSRFLMEKDPELQVTDWTSDTAKILGKLTGVSPALLDHIAYGYGAGTARGIVQYTEAAVRGGLATLGIVPRSNRPSMRPQEMPVIGNFLSDGSASSTSQPMQDFYHAYEEVIRFERSMKAYGNEGTRDPRTNLTPKQAKRIAEARGESWARRAQQIKDAKKDFEAAGDAIEEVYATPADQMTPAEKRKQLNAIYDRMNRIAEEALGRRKGTMPVRNAR